jgi:ribonuclease HI
MKHVYIYTDGSCKCNPGPGGWCAILVYNGVEKVISGGAPETTNNRMELTAIIEALRALKEQCRVTLTSDSKYALDALQNGWAVSWRAKGWRKADKSQALNPDLWEQHLSLVE